MTKKILRSALALIALGALSNSLQGQDRDPFLIEYFWGRQPSARAEAMGRGHVALTGEISSVFYNPAGIGSIRGAIFNTSYASPFYLLDKAKYFFVGAGVRLNPVWVLGLSVNHLTYAEKFPVMAGPDNATQRTYTPQMSNYAFTLTFAPFDALEAGVSANLFSWHYFYGKTTKRAFVDVGLMGTVWRKGTELTEHNLRVGGSLCNLGYSDIEVASYREELPVIARLGLSYGFAVRRNVLVEGLQALGLRVHTEFQDLLNSEHHTAFRAGAEMVFLEMWALRAGYYSETWEDYGNTEVNKSRITDFTYGFGLFLPISRLTHQETPLDIEVDFVSLPQVSHTKTGGGWRNFTSVSLVVRWVFKTR